MDGVTPTERHCTADEVELSRVQSPLAGNSLDNAARISVEVRLVLRTAIAKIFYSVTGGKCAKERGVGACRKRTMNKDPKAVEHNSACKKQTNTRSNRCVSQKRGRPCKQDILSAYS